MELHEWSAEYDLHYLFKVGYCSGTYDRVHRLNNGWKKGHGTKPSCLYLTDWTAIGYWPDLRHKNIERDFKIWMKSRFRWIDPEELLLGREPTGNGDSEIYRLAPEDIAGMAEMRINYPFGAAALDVVACHIRTTLEAEWLPKSG
jgi:hypothetical protein